MINIMDGLWKGGKDGEREGKRQGRGRQASWTPWAALYLLVFMIETNVIMYIQKLTPLSYPFTCA